MIFFKQRIDVLDRTKNRKSMTNKLQPVISLRPEYYKLMAICRLLSNSICFLLATIKPFEDHCIDLRKKS